MRIRLISLSVALFWAMATPAAAADDARAWIARMNESLVNSNYDGVFNIQVGTYRDVVRIIHRMHDGKMSERLIFTNGSGREVVRSGSAWVDFRPAQRVALVETRNRSFGFFATLNGLNEDSAKFYEISTGRTKSMQGRPAQEITILPRDALRYGYRYWLDHEHSMPIKTQRLTREGQVIEEVSFIKLDLPATIPDELLKAEVDTTNFRWMRIDVPLHTEAVKQAFVPRDSLLPEGFRVRIFNSPEAEALAKGPRTRFVVTDGVALISVFIEPPDDRPVGAYQFGATAFFVTKIDGYRITAVGEAPPQTIRTIAEAVRPE